jgi:hypothetical protein
MLSLALQQPHDLMRPERSASDFTSVVRPQRHTQYQRFETKRIAVKRQNFLPVRSYRKIAMIK